MLEILHDHIQWSFPPLPSHSGGRDEFPGAESSNEGGGGGEANHLSLYIPVF